MKTKKFYLSFTLRYPDGSRHDAPSIALPVLYAWQEAPDDFHVQLDTPKGREHLNVFPEYAKHRHDYILPFSEILGDARDFKVVKNYTWRTCYNKTAQHPAVVCCDMQFTPVPPEKRIVAPPAYLELVESLWQSPNR